MCLVGAAPGALVLGGPAIIGVLCGFAGGAPNTGTLPYVFDAGGTPRYPLILLPPISASPVCVHQSMAKNAGRDNFTTMQQQYESKANPNVVSVRECRSEQLYHHAEAI